jgi:hypothetical protein
MLRVLSWNMGHRSDRWAHVLDSGADVALLQEAPPLPGELAGRIDAGLEPFSTAGLERRPWCAAVVALTDRAVVTRVPSGPLVSSAAGEFAVSRPGTLAAAHVVDASDGAQYTLISMYAPWERPHASTGSNWIFADASAHRLVSDISVFVGQQGRHRIVAAGDLNCLHGHGEDGSAYWAVRYRTVFDRLKAIGLDFVGPQSPNGRQADPWPAELPRDSRNVPTFHSNRQGPATATRQLDFVFASSCLRDAIEVHAMNQPEAWGPSDHCRIAMALGTGDRDPWASAGSR